MNLKDIKNKFMKLIFADEVIEEKKEIEQEEKSLEVFEPKHTERMVGESTVKETIKTKNSVFIDAPTVEEEKIQQKKMDVEPVVFEKYEQRDIISPMFGCVSKAEKVASQPVFKNSLATNQNAKVLSPFFGSEALKANQIRAAFSGQEIPTELKGDDAEAVKKIKDEIKIKAELEAKKKAQEVAKLKEIEENKKAEAEIKSKLNEIEIENEKFLEDKTTEFSKEEFEKVADEPKMINCSSVTAKKATRKRTTTTKKTTTRKKTVEKNIINEETK